MAAFFSFFVNADGVEFIDWLQPDEESVTTWRTTTDNTGVDPLSVCSNDSRLVGSTYHVTVEESGDPDLMFCTEWWEQPNTSAIKRQINLIRESEVREVCNERDFPNLEPSDVEGLPGHCHKSLCSIDNEMFENPGINTDTGYVCIGQGNGEFCEHQLRTAEGPNGTQGLDFIIPTGESCGSDDEGLPHDPWAPTEEDDLPDPNDPSSPPADDGNPECTPVDGTGLNICNANPDDVCDSSSGVQICPSGCGYVNEAFVCVTEDGGGEPDVHEDEETNDNSDNQVDDDESTAGDEGTHGRLDGLLENTDGIEGLLQGIKDAIVDIPAGGGDSSDDGEEEPHCAGGEYYIGEQCVTFTQQDRPVINDLDLTALDADIATAETDLTNLFNTIKADLDTKFNVNLTGGVYEARTSNIKGVEVDFGMSRLSSLFNFASIGNIIIFIFSIWAMFILIGPRS